MAKKKRNIEDKIMAKNSYFDDLDNIENTQSDISEVIKDSMFEYGQYIIEERALPNMLDGLKPVQRRSLYAMKAGNMVGSKHYKLARVVGDIIGKYHPHGDSSVVGTIVTMVNKWKNNLPLFEGQGNWGSITGDRNAAMRYIEVKLSDTMNNLIFENLEKENVVPWTPNYDETTEEPRLLPLKYPFHLLNGTSGIAYAMSADIPSYNIKEMTELFIYLIENDFYKDSFNVEEHKEKVLGITKSVDFPTGTNIYFDTNKFEIEDSIFKSRFSFRMRASYDINEKKKEIIIYNIPANVKLNKIKEEILNAKRSYKEVGKRKINKEPTEILNINALPLILPEEEDGTIILTFKKDVDLNAEVAKLFKYTSLDKSFGANIRVIDENGIPVEVSFFDNILKFLKFRQHVVYTSNVHDIKKLEERIHILNGFILALDNIDKIITIIKSNSDSDSAQKELIEVYEFSELQSKSILEMKLSRLTGLEREKLDNELEEKHAIKLEKEILISTSENIFNYIKEEYQGLLETKMVKSKGRQSAILGNVSKFSNEDLIKDREVIVMLMSDDTISYIEADKFKLRNRGTQSQNSKVNTAGYDNMDLEIAEKCNLKEEILLISNFGKAFKMKAYKISNKFNYIGNILNLEEGEKIIYLSKYNKNIEQYLIITKNGKIKGINSSIMKSITENRSTTIIQLDKEDVVQGFGPFSNREEETISIVSTEGKVLKFPSNNVGILKGGNTKGTRAISLYEGEHVSRMNVSVSDEDTLIVVSDIGKAKKTKLKDIPMKKRGQRPIIFYNQDKANGNVVGSEIISDELSQAVMLITEKGNVTIIKIGDFNGVKRNAKGAVKILTLINKDKIKQVKKFQIVEEER